MQEYETLLRAQRVPVQRAHGREPRDFAEYARETAATGVWEAPR
jgi:hypothetical protein